MQLIRDRSHLFALALAILWLTVVAPPLVISILLVRPLRGIPLLIVALWFLAVRIARWLSPAARVEAHLRRGKYNDVLTICDHALALTGEGAWAGPRRLVWLNSRTSALIALGQGDASLVAALDALQASADPETIGNCA